MTLAACATDNDISSTASNAGGDKAVTIASATRAAEGGTIAMTAPFHLVNTTLPASGDEDYQADFFYENGSYSSTSGNFVAWSDKGADGNYIDNVFEAFTPLKTYSNNASYDSFVLPTDQSTAELLLAADWMTATTTSNIEKNNGAISLNFEHKFSKLHFNVVKFKDDVPTLTSNSFCVLDVITPYYNCAPDSIIEAIIDPKWSIDTPIITIKIADNETLSVPIPSTITAFEPGKQYNFNLTIGHDQATISSVSVTDWETKSVTTSKGNEATNGNNYLTFTFTGNQTLVISWNKTGGESNQSAITRAPARAYIRSLSDVLSEKKDVKKVSTVDENTTKYEITGDFAHEISLRLDLENPIYGTVIDDNGTEWYLNIKFENENVPVKCTGDLRSLVDPDNPENADTGNAKFKYLFKDCKPLTSAPQMPATNLAPQCYEGMFEGCENLENAPDLPATELSADCYKDMFKNCSNLENISLPATQLAPGCYKGMLSGCINLEYLEIGATEESFNFEGNDDFKENPAFENFVGQDDGEEEITDDDGSTSIIDHIAGSNTTSRTLVVKNQEVLKKLTDDPFNGCNILWIPDTKGTTILYKD